MKILSIPTGFFKLDGGAMHGVVPKSIWQKANPADENNMCNFESRSFLIDINDRKILIDTGLGDKQPDSFFKHYYRNNYTNLTIELAKNGYKPEDITDVIHTHFHFDHCGGSVKYNHNNQLVPSFPNAKYWCSLNHWELIQKPNLQEKNSFLTENIMPLYEHQRLNFVDNPCSILDDFLIVHEFLPQIKFLEVNGHSRGLLVPIVFHKNEYHVFCSDLIPTFFHIPALYIMSYDTQPLLVYKEKNIFLNHFVDKPTILYFQHDDRIIKSKFIKVNDKFKGERI